MPSEYPTPIAFGAGIKMAILKPLYLSEKLPRLCGVSSAVYSDEIGAYCEELYFRIYSTTD
jgi:hypothetical protein